MRRINFILLFFCVFITSCNTQKKYTDSEDFSVAVDQFVSFNFSKGEYKLTEENTKMLDKLGRMLKENLTDDNNEWYLFEVIPSSNEENCLSYDRLNLIFSYLKENYKIDRSKFKIIFHEKVPVEMFIKFSIIQFHK